MNRKQTLALNCRTLATVVEVAVRALNKSGKDTLILKADGVSHTNPSLAKLVTEGISARLQEKK